MSIYCNIVCQLSKMTFSKPTVTRLVLIQRYDVHVTLVSGVSVPLGWARIPLFQRVSRGSRSSADSQANIEWSLQDGDFVFTLHPGALPQNLISSDAVTPVPEDQVEGVYLFQRSEEFFIHCLLNVCY